MNDLKSTIVEFISNANDEKFKELKRVKNDPYFKKLVEDNDPEQICAWLFKQPALLTQYLFDLHNKDT